MTRQELIREMGAEDNGYFSDVLDDLCNCDFIRSYNAFGKTERDGVVPRRLPSGGQSGARRPSRPRLLHGKVSPQRYHGLPLADGCYAHLHLVRDMGYQ